MIFLSGKSQIINWKLLRTQKKLIEKYLELRKVVTPRGRTIEVLSLSFKLFEFLNDEHVLLFYSEKNDIYVLKIFKRQRR